MFGVNHSRINQLSCRRYTSVRIMIGMGYEKGPTSKQMRGKESINNPQKQTCSLVELLKGLII